MNTHKKDIPGNPEGSNFLSEGEEIEQLNQTSSPGVSQNVDKELEPNIRETKTGIKEDDGEIRSFEGFEGLDDCHNTCWVCKKQVHVSEYIMHYLACLLTLEEDPNNKTESNVMNGVSWKQPVNAPENLAHINECLHNTPAEKDNLMQTTHERQMAESYNEEKAKVNTDCKIMSSDKEKKIPTYRSSKHKGFDPVHHQQLILQMAKSKQANVNLNEETISANSSKDNKGEKQDKEEDSQLGTNAVSETNNEDWLLSMSQQEIELQKHLYNIAQLIAKKNIESCVNDIPNCSDGESSKEIKSKQFAETCKAEDIKSDHQSNAGSELFMRSGDKEEDSQLGAYAVSQTNNDDWLLSMSQQEIELQKNLYDIAQIEAKKNIETSVNDIPNCSDGEPIKEIKSIKFTEPCQQEDIKSDHQGNTGSELFMRSGDIEEKSQLGAYAVSQTNKDDWLSSMSQQEIELQKNLSNVAKLIANINIESSICDTPNCSDGESNKEIKSKQFAETYQEEDIKSDHQGNTGSGLFMRSGDMEEDSQLGAYAVSQTNNDDWLLFMSPQEIELQKKLYDIAQIVAKKNIESTVSDIPKYGDEESNKEIKSKKYDVACQQEDITADHQGNTGSALFMRSGDLEEDSQLGAYAVSRTNNDDWLLSMSPQEIELQKNLYDVAQIVAKKNIESSVNDIPYCSDGESNKEIKSQMFMEPCHQEGIKSDHQGNKGSEFFMRSFDDFVSLEDKYLHRDKLSSTKHSGSCEENNNSALGPVIKYENMTYEEKSKMLLEKCGVVSELTGRICRCSIRCVWHSEEERMLLRASVLSPPSLTPGSSDESNSAENADKQAHMPTQQAKKY